MELKGVSLAFAGTSQSGAAQPAGKREGGRTTGAMAAQDGFVRRYRYAPENNLISRLLNQAAPESAVADRTLVQVSRHFSPDGQEQGYTYRQLLEDAQKMAAGFRSKGLAGKRIAVAETNSLDMLSTYYGALMVGATVVPLNLLALQDEGTKKQNLAHMLNGPGCDALVVGQDKLFNRMKIFSRILSVKRLLHRDEPSRIKLITPRTKARFMRREPLPVSQMVTAPEPQSLADIIFTSGTSGKPKGVALTHQNLVFTTTSLDQALSDVLKPDDVMLLGLPLFHIFGKAVQLLGMNRQVPVVLLPSLSDAIRNLDKVVDTIRDYHVTVLPAVPIFLERLLAYAEQHPEAKDVLKNIRVVVSGGAALKADTYKALKELNPDIRIMEGYGSSEGGINMLNKSGTPGYVGEPLPGVKVKMIESDPRHAFHGFSKSVGEGEILVQSPGVSPGYVEGTVPADSRLGIADDKGWFHTGDQGRRLNVPRPGTQPGDFGHLALGPMQIIGRDSNFIKDTGGERRDPAEFEKAVRQADPRISEALAVSYNPNRETEKSVVVAISADPAVTEQSVKAALHAAVTAGKMPGALVPKHILVLHRDSLPSAFRNDFKRESAYKAVRDFVGQVATQKLAVFQDKTGTEREKTLVPEPQTLENFAETYRFTGK